MGRASFCDPLELVVNPIIILREIDGVHCTPKKTVVTFYPFHKNVKYVVANASHVAILFILLKLSSPLIISLYSKPNNEKNITH